MCQEGTLGARFTSHDDASGRLLANEDTLGRRWSQIYNALGMALSNENPLGHRSSSVYDARGARGARGARIGEVNPLGQRVTFLYDGRGQDWPPKTDAVTGLQPSMTPRAESKPPWSRVHSASPVNMIGPHEVARLEAGNVSEP